MKTAARILVVDDEPAVVRRISTLLRQAKYKVWSAATGRQALQLARLHSPDLVLLDRMLPDVSGREVCWRIKHDAALCDISVVLLSDDAKTRGNSPHTSRNGADEYLEKGLPGEKLLARIRMLLRLHSTTAALRASEQHLRSLLSHSRLAEARKDAVMQAALDGIITFDHEGKIVEFNATAKRMFGLNRKDTYGKPLGVVIALPPIREWGKRPMTRLTARKADGSEFPIEMTVRRIGLPGPPLFTAFIRDVTELTRSQEQLTVLAHAVEGTPEAICITDLQDRFSFVNRAFLKTYGYTEEEILGKTPSVLFSRNNPPGLLREILVQTREAGWRGEVLDKKKDGTEIPMLLSTSPIKDKAGRVLGLMGVAQNISERKRTEQQIRLLADAVQSAQEMISVTDSHNRFVFVNRAFLQAYGYTESEVLGKTPDFLHSPRNPRHLLAEVLRQTLKGNWRGELLNVRKDGTEFPISLTTSPIKNPKGEVTALIGIARDITSRKRDQQRLADALELNLTILAASSLGIVAFREAGQCIFANSAAGRIVGATAEDLLEQNFRQLRSWRKYGLLTVAKKTLRTRKVQATELQMRTTFGKELWLECHMAPFVSGNELHLLVLLDDVSDRKLAEERLHQLPQRIIDAQETERRRVGSELHDSVNQLIASAKMRLNKVQQRLLAHNPVAREIISRCDELLVQALEENRRIANNLRPPDLSELGLATACLNLCEQLELRTNVVVRCAFRNLARKLPAHIELNVFRILQEGLNNVEKHAQAKKVRLQIRANARLLEMKLQDDGRGFSPGKKKKPEPTHNGLGLTNMLERAVSLNGTCELHSAPGRGTVLRVRIPIP